MQRREKLLLGAFLAVLLVWWGYDAFERTYFGPLEERRTRLSLLAAEIEQKEERELQVLRAGARLKDWKEHSLPPDALDAQRLYQQWLTDLAHVAGLTDVKVTPGRRRAQGQTYVAVQVAVEARGTLEAIALYLYHFHRAALLQQVVQMTIEQESAGETGNRGTLQFAVTAEGLLLTEAPPRERLFPAAELAAAVQTSADRLPVRATGEFPQKPGFRIRIGNEYATVTALGQDEWTVTRGVDRTRAAAHQAGTPIELAPVAPEAETRSFDEYQSLVDRRAFMKPVPRGLQLPRLSEQAVNRGTPLVLELGVGEYDPALGRPVYGLEGAPPGMSIDSQTGRLTWNPPGTVRAGNYTATVRAQQGQRAETRVTTPLRIVLREDPAASTVFVASLLEDDAPRAWLYDSVNSRRFVLELESRFTVADIVAVVREIGRDFLIFETDAGVWRIELGQSLRARTRVSAPAPGSPGNAPQEPSLSAAMGSGE